MSPRDVHEVEAYHPHVLSLIQVLFDDALRRSSSTAWDSGTTPGAAVGFGVHPLTSSLLRRPVSRGRGSARSLSPVHFNHLARATHPDITTSIVDVLILAWLCVWISFLAVVFLKFGKRKTRSMAEDAKAFKETASYSDNRNNSHSTAIHKHGAIHNQQTLDPL